MTIEKHCKYFKEGECKGLNKVVCPFQDIDDVVNCTDPKEQYITRLKADIVAVLDKIRAEIFKYEADCRLSVDEYPSCKECTDNVFRTIYNILDKHKAEMEETK